MKIVIKNLTKKFDDVIAIDNLSVTFNDGVTGLVGHNGAGKSTLFRCIADIIKFESGEILINGKPFNNNDVKNDLFFLSDTPFYPRRSSPNQVFNYYNAFFDMDKKIFKEMISSFSLPENRNIDDFSKGMQRQLFIAIALSMNVRCLLLDEAFDGIDLLAVTKIKEMIEKRRKDGIAIIISSHNINTLQNLVDQFVILYKGKLSKEGNEEHLSQEFVKFQILTDAPLTKDSLVSIGLTPITINKIGSINQIVFVNCDNIKQKLIGAYKPQLIENVSIDSNELIAIEMKYAKINGETKDE